MEHNLVAVSTALYGLCDDFLSIVLLVFSIATAAGRYPKVHSKIQTAALNKK